jgi:hypothetical protein
LNGNEGDYEHGNLPDNAARAVSGNASLVHEPSPIGGAASENGYINGGQLMRSSLHLCVFVGFALCYGAVGSQARADVKVSGVTLEMNKDGTYQPLGGVIIQAYRNGAPLLADPIMSKDKTGEFSFTVKEGEPFDVLFFGGPRVPELTQLAGNPMGKNEVNVALLTIEQYMATAKGKKVPARERILCMVKQLPEDDEVVRKARAVGRR